MIAHHALGRRGCQWVLEMIELFVADHSAMAQRTTALQSVAFMPKTHRMFNMGLGLSGIFK